MNMERATPYISKDVIILYNKNNVFFQSKVHTSLLEAHYQRLGVHNSGFLCCYANLFHIYISLGPFVLPLGLRV